MTLTEDKNCLSYWFPRIEAAGLPVPETAIVRAEMDLTPLVDGEVVVGISDFLDELAEVAEAIGYPVFLRTGHGSGKHDWERTCYIADLKDLGQHVFNLVEWSCTVDIMGLPTDVWAVREMLSTMPFFTAFRGMPICREFRVFVDGPKIICAHPYWPRGALVAGFPGQVRGREGSRQLPKNFSGLYQSLCELGGGDRIEVSRIASAAGQAVGGAWSVDVLETKQGWYLTDMAEASRSFHWDGCSHAQKALA